MGFSPIIETPVYFESFDNVLKAAFSQTMPVNSFASVYVQAVAVRPSTGDSKTWNQTFTCGRRAASPIINATTNVSPIVSDVGATAWNLAFIVVGNDITIQVQGQSLGDTIWFLRIQALVLRD
jgi:hypothetical protein